MKTLDEIRAYKNPAEKLNSKDIVNILHYDGTTGNPVQINITLGDLVDFVRERLSTSFERKHVVLGPNPLKRFRTGMNLNI